MTLFRILIAKSCIIPTLFYGLEIYANCGVASQHKLKIAYEYVGDWYISVYKEC